MEFVGLLLISVNMFVIVHRSRSIIPKVSQDGADQLCHQHDTAQNLNFFFSFEAVVFSCVMTRLEMVGNRQSRVATAMRRQSFTNYLERIVGHWMIEGQTIDKRIPMGVVTTQQGNPHTSR